MKKYLLYLAIIPATISIAASNIDLKLATNFGIGLEGGTYYNLYGSKGHSRKSNESDQAIFVNKIAFTGSFEAKIFKSFSIKKDLKIKIGAGTSIDITKLPELNEIKDVKISVKEENGKNVELPHTESPLVGLKLPFQSQVIKYENEWFVDTNTQMSKLIDLSRKRVYTSLTVFLGIEIEKMFKNFSVYFGVDSGLDIVLDKIEEKAKHKDEYLDIVYLLERRKSRVRPKLKGYVGINYKGFETEIGLGYPQFVTIGLGYRFNL